MTAAQQQELVERYYRLFNAWDGLARNPALEALLAPEFVAHEVHLPFRPGLKNFSRVGVRRRFFAELMAAFKRAFPDLRAELQALEVTPRGVEDQVLLRGTHQKALAGFPATGERVVLVARHRWQMRDGLLPERWDISPQGPLRRVAGFLSQERLSQVIDAR